MAPTPNDPRLKRALNQPPNGPGDNINEQAAGCEGGDDSLSNIRPTDDRADEKVIVNSQQAQQTVNRPSQSEIDGSYSDVVNE